MKKTVTLLIVIHIFCTNAYSDYRIRTQTVLNGSKHPSDDRLVKTKDSPRYLDAVGRLRIIKSDGTAEVCGASLVGILPNVNSRIVLTSLHCLKTNRMTWTTVTKDGLTIKRNIKEVVYDYRKNDYAFLLLDKAVNYREVKPLLIDFVQESSIIGHMSRGEEFAVAGYSSDAEVGQGGHVLTYDIKGRLAAVKSSGDPIGGGSEGITTYGGASGGAVIVVFKVRDDYTEKPGLIEGTHAFLFGIIKGGITDDFVSSNGVKGSNNTRFVTYTKFTDELEKTLRKYNGEVDGRHYSTDDWDLGDLTD